jgi:hypothetical protein
MFICRGPSLSIGFCLGWSSNFEGSESGQIHANEGPVKILYKCLVPICILPQMKLLFPKQNYNVLSPSSYTHISVRYFYISRIGLPILLQDNMWTNPGNI